MAYHLRVLHASRRGAERDPPSVLRTGKSHLSTSLTQLELSLPTKSGEGGCAIHHHWTPVPDTTHIDDLTGCTRAALSHYDSLPLRIRPKDGARRLVRHAWGHVSPIHPCPFWGKPGWAGARDLTAAGCDSQLLWNRHLGRLYCRPWTPDTDRGGCAFLLCSSNPVFIWRSPLKVAFLVKE